MDLESLVFHKAITARGLERPLWSAFRRALIRFKDDPTCTMPIHGRPMKVNLSHGLPVYQAVHPFYDTLPRRLGSFLRQRHGGLRCVDVGANIGDSIAAFIGGDDDRFLAVEPNPKFFAILQANWSADPRVTAVDVICSSASQGGSFTIHEKNGTASIVAQADGSSMNQKTLDQLIAEHASFDRVNLIKIDTDGHDFEVLSGAAGTIARHRPAVLFECDVFGRTDYTQCVLDALDGFARRGYAHCLLYDNYGFLIGLYGLKDHAAIKSLLFYQLTSHFHYFDVLVMADGDLQAFHADEVAFFTDQLADAALRPTAREAAHAANRPA